MRRNSSEVAGVGPGVHRSASKRSSLTSSFTWSKLARQRRSTSDYDSRRLSNISSNISSRSSTGFLDDSTITDRKLDATGTGEGKDKHNGAAALETTNQDEATSSELPSVTSSLWSCTNCWNSTRTSIKTRSQSLGHSFKKASQHPRTIVLPTLLTFALLCSAGLVSVIHSSHKYHSSQNDKLLEETRELAYELDDLLSQALLPLFTLQEMAGQIEEFRELHEMVVQEKVFIDEENNGGRSFRNITDICTNPEVLGLYQRAAESIGQSSKMGRVLLNVQLQPAGTVCLNYPPSTTFPNGNIMDHTKAIGLDTIHDKYQRGFARASIESTDVSTAGPIVLVQDSDHDRGQHASHEHEASSYEHEALLFWTPIFSEEFNFVTVDDSTRYENFWGFALILLDWAAVLESVELYEFFEERGTRFALVEKVMDGKGQYYDKLVEFSGGPPLTRIEAKEALQLQARKNWELLVDVAPHSNPTWIIWGSLLVILGSFVISLAFMQVLVSRKDHEELLCRCIPRDIVRRLHAGETVIEKYDVATICFIDIVSFTTMSGRMKAHEVMEMLQLLFREFDQLTEKHDCFNAETIGDAYITVSGGPEGNDSATGAANIAAFALDAVDAVQRLEFDGGKKIKIRVGVATGSVVAGVIGTDNVPKFTLFGETTSRAEEMESTSLPMQIQCSGETMKLLRGNFRTNNSFQCKRRKGVDDNENTWWIIRPDDNSTEPADIAPALLPAREGSTITSTTMAQSEPRQSIVSGPSFSHSEPQSALSSGPEESEAARQDSHCARSAKSGVTNSSKDAQSDSGSVQLENYLSNKNAWQDNEDTGAKTCLSKIKIPLRRIGRMFRVAASSRRIMFGTLLTFSLLCGVGLAILYIFADEYEKEKYQDALDMAKKADRWLDKEISKALLPLFAMSELIKVVGKWNDLPFKLEQTHQYDKGTSAPIVFNNVTGICDDPAYRNPFVNIASSIKNSSGMQGILVNVQLAPVGVICLTYPKNNTEDFPPGVYLDTSGAIGLSLFDTPNRAFTSKAAVHKGEKTIQGPIKLAQGNLSVVDEAIIARYPVFTDSHNMTVDGKDYPFWGLTIVLIDWDKLKTKFDIYNFFSRAGLEFRMTRYDSWNDKLLVIAKSSNHEILGDHNSLTYDLQTSDDAWTLIVGYSDGFSPSWVGWGTAVVIIGSFLLSVLVMVVLAVTKQNKMLLYRMMPKEAIISAEQGKTFVERDSEATVFFSQLIGFQKISGEMSSKDFIMMLTQLYTDFDKLALKYQCTKIETIGAYYIVKGPGQDLCGVDEREGVVRIALFALDAMDLVRNYQYKGVKLQIRAGFASGPVVSGVIGSGGLPKYTVFGDTVNFSSRMESTSHPMRIQCPFHTFKLLRNSSEFIFELEEREEEGELGVYVKGKGQTMTYFLNGYSFRGAVTGSGATKKSYLQSDVDVPRCSDLDIEANNGANDSGNKGDRRVSFKDVSFKECVTAAEVVVEEQ